MEVRYRGFVGTVVHDMNTDIYKISGRFGGYGKLVEVESPASCGQASTAPVCTEFLKAVNEALAPEEGEIIPEGGDGDSDSDD